MKKFLALFLSAVFLFTLLACSSGNEPPSSTSSYATQTPGSDDIAEGGTNERQSGDIPAGAAILLAYFSVPETDGVDTVAGASRVVVDSEVLGNNQYLAELIRAETGGELFRIETVQAYPGTHQALLDFVQNEPENARPELSSHLQNPDQYDVIFLGYPIWNADL